MIGTNMSVSYLLRLCIVMLSGLTIIIKGENFTRSYMTMDASGFQSRQNRLFSFTTDGSGEISIEIQFSVPFIKIPVKKALDVGRGAFANFDVGSLAIGGFLAVLTGIILPSLKTTPEWKSYKPFHPKYGKLIKEEPFEWWRLTTLIEQTLNENNVDSTTCMQKAICWMVQSSLNQHRVIDSLLSNEWIKEFLDGTPLQSAIENGIQNKDCGDEYVACKLNTKMLVTFVRQITKAMNLT